MYLNETQLSHFFLIGGTQPFPNIGLHSTALSTRGYEQIQGDRWTKDRDRGCSEEVEHNQLLTRGEEQARCCISILDENKYMEETHRLKCVSPISSYNRSIRDTQHTYHKTLIRNVFALLL